MFNLSFEQHTKLLGFSIIAYGTSTFIMSLGTIWAVFSLFGPYGVPTRQSDIVASQLLAPVVKVTVAVLCGTLLISRDARISFNVSSQIACLIFAFFSFSDFPLGSILSAYALYYTVKLYPENPEVIKSAVINVESDTVSDNNKSNGE